MDGIWMCIMFIFNCFKYTFKAFIYLIKKFKESRRNYLNNKIKEAEIK